MPENRQQSDTDNAGDPALRTRQRGDRDRRDDRPLTKAHSGTDIEAGREFADRMPEASKTDMDEVDRERRRLHQEDLVDEAVEETFPASDPISPKQIT